MRHFWTARRRRLRLSAPHEAFPAPRAPSSDASQIVDVDSRSNLKLKASPRIKSCRLRSLSVHFAPAREHRRGARDAVRSHDRASREAALMRAIIR